MTTPESFNGRLRDELFERGVACETSSASVVHPQARKPFSTGPAPGGMKHNCTPLPIIHAFRVRLQTRCHLSTRYNDERSHSSLADRMPAAFAEPQASGRKG
jgi:hypothetical protein